MFSEHSSLKNKQFLQNFGSEWKSACKIVDSAADILFGRI